jgi:REP element-mobilizing transposase RayT
MPDHLHILIQGKEGSSLGEFMRIFKQKSEYYFRKEADGFLWQRSYYDHVLRKEESIEEVAKYILENPVRKGLVNNFVDYPFSGSMVFDIKEL